jgi:hypothetical protein
MSGQLDWISSCMLRRHFNVDNFDAALARFDHLVQVHINLDRILSLE